MQIICLILVCIIITFVLYLLCRKKPKQEISLSKSLLTTDQKSRLKIIHRQLYDLLEGFLSLGGHLKYWASDGTLLGAVRHKEIIPHDDDIDLMLPSESIKKLKSMTKMLRENGFELKFDDNIWRFKYLDPNKTTYIDLFEVEENPNENAWMYKDPRNLDRWPYSYIKKNEVGDLIFYDFGKYKIKGPDNPIPYLERLYGADWRIPKISHFHQNV